MYTSRTIRALGIASVVFSLLIQPGAAKASVISEAPHSAPSVPDKPQPSKEKKPQHKKQPHKKPHTTLKPKTPKK